jgi:hypothetical protein
LIKAAISIGLAAALRANAASVDENQLKAALLFKFAEFTDWPPPAGKEFAFCVIGKDVMSEGLSKLKGKTLRGNPVAVRLLNSIDEAKGCQVLFLGASGARQIAQWLENLKGQPVLTVSDHPDAWDQGVMIALTTEPNRIAFSIDATAARAAGLAFRAQMLQLAQEVR